MNRNRIFLAIAVVFFAAITVNAQNTFYCDPVNGSMSGDGSAANPWRTIQEVINAGLIDRNGGIMDTGSVVTGGDTILLRSGYHGYIHMVGHRNTDYITIAAEQGHTPQLAYIHMEGGSYWIFRGLTVSPSLAPSYSKRTIVNFQSRNSSGGTCSYMTVEDCFIYSHLDMSGWSASQWSTQSCSGVNLGYQGQYLTARNNRILNIYFGVTAEAYGALAEGNEIVNFAGDGVRATMHEVVVQYNVIKNCYNVDDNHDDGIQGYYAYSGAGLVRNVTLRGNLIIQTDDDNRPHQGPLQGIGVFDGPPENWLVENNVVLVGAWHGISLLGAIDCKLLNNTVINPWYLRGISDTYTWIETDQGKDGSNATGCVIRNNLANRINTTGNSNLSYDHNITIGRDTNKADSHFVDWRNFDMHLKEGSTAIDNGSAAMAPSLDIEQGPRPRFSGYDIGAYEYGNTSTLRGVHIFYNNSAFDGYDPAANEADDAAMATDKSVLETGVDAKFVNYTSYDKGINGIMIDLLDAQPTISASDFEFTVGNDNDVDNWAAAPAPVSVTYRPDAGDFGSHRVMITWADKAIKKQWLRIKILANANTGMQFEESCYFGNAIGDTGDSSSFAIVDATDQINCRNNPRNFAKPAAIDDVHDFNRDGKVDATDEIIARNNTTTAMTMLKLITP